MSDIESILLNQVSDAVKSETAVRIRGNGSKSFLGNDVNADLLQVNKHTGIIEYEPSELYLRARAGTPLSEIESLLKQHGQKLAFEPPNIDQKSTLGGCIATALSGPSRPFLGSVRDHVLGIKCINGHAEILNFGGKVIKNVAGYDLSRLMTGAFGTLGLILEATVKVVPEQKTHHVYSIETDIDTAISRAHKWLQKPLPITACAIQSGKLLIRLSGNDKMIEQAANDMNLNHTQENHSDWFQNLQHFRHDIFKQDGTNLWRISLPALVPPLELPGQCLYDWAATLRWIKTDEEADAIRQIATQYGGHATLFYSKNDQINRFHQQNMVIHDIQKNLKQAFDPKRIFNPGIMYKDI